MLDSSKVGWGAIKMAQLTVPRILRGEFREEVAFFLFYIASRSFKGNSISYVGNGEEFGVARTYGWVGLSKILSSIYFCELYITCLELWSLFL